MFIFTFTYFLVNHFLFTSKVFTGKYFTMKNAVLSFKVEPAFKEALERLAKTENRSLSNYVQTILLNHLADKGIDPSTPTKKKKS